MLEPIHTPLVRLGNLFPNRRVFAKCEHLQPSGCFKIRGIANLLANPAGLGGALQLVVPSMGNTAIASAVGARERGLTMLGVVPQSIGAAKDRKLRALGAELLKVAGGGNELLSTARRVAQERSAYFVHPHLDPLWTDGYRAIVEQVLQDLPDLKSLVFPVGGGGLLMGLTAALRERPASVRSYGCEAFNCPTYAAFKHERSPTIADGLVLETPHLAVQQRIEATGVKMALVHDEDIRVAMRELYNWQGLYVEPSSAVTTAFVRSHLAELEDPICVVLTGSNIAEADFHRL